MNLTKKSNSPAPALVPDWLSPSTLFDRDFFDIDPQLVPVRLGINTPSANITEKPGEYLVELAAPGLERKDFMIEVDNHMLTISAEKEEKTEHKKDESGYSKKEYSFNSFCRSFTLPENVTEARIEATYKDGILRVAVPKAKETPVKPVRKIPVV